jgi:superoxide dismutase, Fe-Mn family
MDFKKLKSRIKELEEKIELDEVITRQIGESFSDNKEILLEMKKVGIERLTYSYSALGEFIDRETMMVHYTKHYKGYVDKLNKALEKRKGSDMELEQIVKGISRFNQEIRNNAGGAFNHALFWKMLSPKQQRPQGPVYEKIIEDFGSYEKFKEKFSTEAKKKFGSGWVWLVVTNAGGLKITTTSNQDNPLMDAIKEGGYPILGLDLWEHAYYLKYKNRRDQYIENFWKVVNWSFVNRLFSEKTEKKLQESVQLKEILKEATSQPCNSKQVNMYREIFNNNPDVKKKYMFAIMDILAEVFSDYWYEKNKYAPNTMSGVYDFEQSGRSVINKLNTNYTAFCTLINDINIYLNHIGVNQIVMVGETPESQLKETERFIRYLVDLRYRIFNPESKTFKSIMSSLDSNNKFGDERELQAVLNMKKIFNTPEVFKVGELGGVDDMLGGVDAYVVTGEGNKTIQVKPYTHTEEKDGKVTIFNTANVKPYKTDYLAFHSGKTGTIVFTNDATEIVNGNYVFPVESQVK